MHSSRAHGLAELLGACCAATLVPAAGELEQACDGLLARQVLREQVSWVHFTRDFSQFNSLVGELLHFSGWNVQVANGVKLQKPESNWVIENDLGKVGNPQLNYEFRQGRD